MMRRFAELQAMTIAFAALLAGACTTDIASTPTGDPVHNEPIADGFTLVHGDTVNGVYATYRDGDVAFRLESRVVGDQVRATVRTEDNQLITSLTVPLGTDQEVGSNLGTLARAAASQPAAIPVDNLLPYYSAALQKVFDATGKMDRSTVRFALMWQEEVLIRELKDPTATDVSRDTWWDDQVYDLDDPNELVHTNLMIAPYVQSYRTAPQGGQAEAEKCNLHCKWYDVCCQHDEACVNCDHWYCGWDCCPGCFGGDCGGCQ